MKRKFFVSMLALVVGLSACCSDCNKSCNKEVSECSKKKAKHFTEMLSERLELTAEQAKSVEFLMIEKFEKELLAHKQFEAELEKIVGAEKFQSFKDSFKNCPKKHSKPCPSMMQGSCKGERQCVKSDSCKKSCEKVCSQVKNDCKKACPKCSKNKCTEEN